MSGAELILAIRPILTFSVEACPGILEAGGFDQSQVRGPLGEGFIEPQVVPPFHRD